MIGRVPRQNRYGRHGSSVGQRAEEITVVLRDATASPEGVRNKGKHRGRWLHATCASGRFARVSPFSTACDQRRETRPLAAGTQLAGSKAPATAFIQPLVGTPKPVLVRVSTSSGSGTVGALASAILPA